METRIYKDQIRILYGNCATSLFAQVLLASLLLRSLNDVTDVWKLVVWFVLILSALCLRGALLYHWHQAKKQQHEFEHNWLTRYRLIIILNSAVWGLAGVLFFSAEFLPHQLYLGFVLAGISAGGSVALSVDRISVVSHLLIILSPYTLMLFLQNDPLQTNMALMCVLFILFLLMGAKQSGHSLHENNKLLCLADESEQRFRMMLEQSPVATRIFDLETKKNVFVNDSYLKLVNLSREEALQINPAQFYKDNDEFNLAMEEVKQGKRITNKLIKLNVNVREVWLMGSYQLIEYNNKPAIHAWLYDITERKHYEDEIQYLAHHDSLTGLPNRILFMDRLQQALSKAVRDKNMLSLMFLDLDGFKHINDNYGHDVGDLLLQITARRIKDCLRTSDTVGRFGGDEFVVLLTEHKHEADVNSIAEKIRLALLETFEIDGQRLQVSVSIGIATYPEHAQTQRGLMRNADIAMYQAKSHGKNTIQTYEPVMENIGNREVRGV